MLKIFPGAAAGLLGALLSGCAGHSPAPGDAGTYRVLWSVERVADHAVLGGASARVKLGGSAFVKTDQPPPTEDRPAVTSFRASLQRGPSPGVIEVISRTALTEMIRTPKGKLKRQKRAIGALIPMRAGERELSSSTSDPIAVTLQLERAVER